MLQYSSLDHVPKNTSALCLSLTHAQPEPIYRTHEVAYGSKLELLSTTETAEVPDGEDNSPSQRAIGANPAGDTLLISQVPNLLIQSYYDT
jgi:hypothetical protein